MNEILQTEAEIQAQKAEELPAFRGIKLLHIKQQVTELLNLIGRDGIFDEYTLHNITHVNEMLKILSWLIPDDTKSIMTPADWLMTVLSIYFHDLGMLVTRKEYEQRNLSGFPEYRDTILFGGERGSEYRTKVEELPSYDEAERFLYQEFVRHTHADRISDWVKGHVSSRFGITENAASLVDNLLVSLDRVFRRDLALVCKSHHDDPLNNFQIYKVSQPYGNSDEETANLHYSAILLRTADLLQITNKRTPSIVFQVIDPIDPLSQQEWAKQSAVRCIRPQIVGLKSEDEQDEKASKDTIEVHAYFTEESGFFGLTSYLLYARNQIRKSHGWTQEANKCTGIRHQFPWNNIDQSNIETEGFLQNNFSFTFDEAKTLDLLTGHTLYNDTRVVLRELIQNSLDAIRLQRLINEQNRAIENIGAGKIEIQWDSQKHILSVKDNGTGMTQDIIEKHLLKVGASRYQDQEFKKDYPDFSPISRFGIGLFSAFMVADTVEVITCHPDEEKARRLLLRSVHGKYLIRLLDKHTDEIARQLGSHGTLVILKVRRTVNILDVLETAKRWVVVPDCEVTVRVNGNQPVQVGYSSPKEALIDILSQSGILIDEKLDPVGRRNIKVIQKELNDVTLAFAVKWWEYFQEWTLLEISNIDISEEEGKPLLLGTCIEGIRVDFNTPGFNARHIFAIANVKGPNAPKTNVVRTSLEVTPEYNAMCKAVYSMYCDHIRSEMEALYKE